MNRNLQLYSHFLEQWVADYGPKPTIALLLAAQGVGVRPGSKRAFALAMCLRPDGATQAQIKKVLGQYHRNILHTLIRERKVKRVSGSIVNGHAAWKLVVAEPVVAKPKQRVQKQHQGMDGGSAPVETLAQL